MTNLKVLFKISHLFLKNLFLWLPFVYKNLDRSPPLNPKSNSCDTRVQGLRLHIGCGSVNLQGWVNIDARDQEHIHLVTDKIDLAGFSDNSIEEIYISHFLEHFSFVESNKLLRLFASKLTSTGKLRISVPDFDKLILTYNANGSDLDLIKFAVMGGQDYPYNFHKSLYNHKTLSALLLSSGFSHVVDWIPNDFFNSPAPDYSDCHLGYRFKRKYPISLNLIAFI
ncbi:hypothetical protein OAE36_00005 [bacterium]|nr:hypothetical protein [bacterium]